MSKKENYVKRLIIEDKLEKAETALDKVLETDEVIEVDPEYNPGYVIGPGDEVPRLATKGEPGYQSVIEHMKAWGVEEVSLAQAGAIADDATKAFEKFAKERATDEGMPEAIAILSNTHPGSVRFHEIIRELATLHDRKQKDYGSAKDPFANVRATEYWGVPAWIGALMRLNDKVIRLQSLARNGSLANEAAEDSMRDIAVYAIIALVLWEEHQANEPKSSRKLRR